MSCHDYFFDVDLLFNFRHNYKQEINMSYRVISQGVRIN